MHEEKEAVVETLNKENEELKKGNVEENFVERYTHFNLIKNFLTRAIKI